MIRCLVTFLFSLALMSSVLGPARGQTAQDPATLLVTEGEDPKAFLAAPGDTMGPVQAVAFNQDGSILCTGSDDGLARLWEWKTGKLLRTVQGHNKPVHSVAISPDGRLLATGSGDNMARLWEIRTGKLLYTLRAHNGRVLSVVFSPDGRLLATGSADSSAKLWKVASGELDFSLNGHRGEINAVAFSPDGLLLATGSSDTTARLWNLAAGQPLVYLNGHREAVRAIAFSPNGKTVATGSVDGTVQLWNAASGATLYSLFGHFDSVRAVAFSPDGELLATGADNHQMSSSSTGFDGSAKLWDVMTGQLLRSSQGYSSPVSAIAFNPDGQTIAIGSHEREVTRWEPKSGRLRRSFQEHSSPVNAVAFSPDGQLVAVASESPTALLWNIKTGKLLRSLQGHDEAVHAVAFSRDGHLVLTGSDDRSARLWDADTGRQRHRLTGHSSLVLAVAFSPDGQTVATGSYDNTVILWNAATGERLHTLELHSSAILAVAFSRDGQLLASGSYDGTVRLWNATTGKPLHVLDCRSSPVNAVSFSPDGHLIVTGADDHTVKLWNAMTGKLLRSLEGHRSPVNAAVFSPNGQLIATASDDRTVKLWNATSGKLLRDLRGHRDEVDTVAFSPDGSLMATGSDDSTVCLWDANDFALRGTLELSGNGWAATVANTGKLYRHDDGRVLKRKNADGSFAAVLPPQPVQPAQLELVWLPARTQPILDAEVPGRVVVQIHNAEGAGRAYWLRLSSPDLAKDAIFLSPEPYLRLEPGASVELPVDVSTPSKKEDAFASPIRFTIQLDHAFGRGPDVQVELPRRLPLLRLLTTKLSGDGSSAQANLELRNDGDQDPQDVIVDGCVLPVSADDDPVAPCAEPNTAAIFNKHQLAPGRTAALSLQVPKDLRVYYKPLRVKLSARGSIWPTHVWRVQSEPVLLRPPLLLWGGAAALLVALLSVGVFVRFYLDPIVRQVAKEPSRLLRLPLEQLPAADRALRRLSRLESALTAANISPERWARALTTGHTPTRAAQTLCEALGAKLGETITTVQPAFAVELPPLRLRFAQHSALVVLTGRTVEPGAVARLAADIYAEGQGPSVALALDFTMTQQARQALSEAPHVSFVVLTAADVRTLLLGGAERDALEAAIASQRPIVELSPYQIGGGVEDPRMFFGRAPELRRLADEKLHNVLLVGPRQMGKSSLLNALQRRLSQRRDVLAVHRITLSNGLLLPAVLRERDSPAAPSADDDTALFTLLAGERDRARVWLIDEADELVAARDWQSTARVLRALSEENRAHFVLAGFWRLYVAAALDPHSPLRNFGQTLRLGPLDRPSARELVVEPLSALGLLFEDAELPTRLLDATGCRANLLSLCCDGLIRTLAPTTRTINRTQLERVLSSYQPLHDELKYWRTSPAKTQAPLDRAVLRAALLLQQRNEVGSAQRIKALLQEFGPKLPTEDYRQSLDRLELGYLLIQEEDPKSRALPRGLVCPIPLIASAISQEDLGESITEDLADLAQSSRSEVSADND